MKKRTILALLATITAGSLLLGGCGGLDLTKVNQDDTTLSAEMEQENLSDGTIQLHSVWYNADNTPLASATITFSDDTGVLFSGTTDEYGNLEACTLTGNTTLACEITDSTGQTLASASLACKISDDYESLTVYPVHSGDDSDSDREHVMEFPSAKTTVRSAIYLTEDGEITIANLSPYYESADTSAEGEAATDASTEGEATDASTEGEATDASTEGETTDASADAAAEGTVTE